MLKCFPLLLLLLSLPLLLFEHFGTHNPRLYVYGTTTTTTTTDKCEDTAQVEGSKLKLCSPLTHRTLAGLSQQVNFLHAHYYFMVTTMKSRNSGGFFAVLFGLAVAGNSSMKSRSAIAKCTVLLVVPNGFSFFSPPSLLLTGLFVLPLIPRRSKFKPFTSFCRQPSINDRSAQLTPSPTTL